MKSFPSRLRQIIQNTKYAKWTKVLICTTNRKLVRARSGPHSVGFRRPWDPRSSLLSAVGFPLWAVRQIRLCFVRDP